MKEEDKFSREWFVTQIHDKNRSVEELAEELPISDGELLNVLQEKNIIGEGWRNSIEAKDVENPHDKFSEEWFEVEVHQRGRTIESLAEELPISEKTLRGVLFEHGIITEDVNLRQNKKHIGDDYRESVGECECCGDTEFLTVHHLTPVRENPDLIDDEDNMMCLCEGCHSLVDKFYSTNEYSAEELATKADFVDEKSSIELAVDLRGSKAL